MKCQHCLVQEANFHYKSNINGEITEQHLCADCAQTKEGHFFASALAGQMESFFGGDMLLRGRQSFAPQLAVRQVYAPRRQEPKLREATIPYEVDDVLKQRRQLNVLRQEMQAAIETENFERATELRDEIGRLEQEM